jgi:hypothetical protein
MKHQIYQNSKALLISEAKKIKSQSNDKGYIRQSINDELDSISRQIHWHAMKETISERMATQYCLWLANLACKLHPKDKAQRRSESYHASLLYGINNQ